MLFRSVHEWLWRGEYGPFADRAAEVQKVYEGTDEQVAREVLAKYKVKYIFVGDMERKKYPALNEQLIQKLTKVVYHSGETRVYEVL